MQRSTERMLTTHVGSLPRPPDLLEMINAKEEGRPFDLSRYRARVKSAVREAVEKQAAAGIDISADGEMGRVGFIPYVNERLSGIEPRQAARGQHQWRRSREYQAFPEYYEWASAIAGAAGQAPAGRGDDVAGYDRRQLLDDPRSAAEEPMVCMTRRWRKTDSNLQ